MLYQRDSAAVQELRAGRQRHCHLTRSVERPLQGEEGEGEGVLQRSIVVVLPVPEASKGFCSIDEKGNRLEDDEDGDRKRAIERVDNPGPRHSLRDLRCAAVAHCVAAALGIPSAFGIQEGLAPPLEIEVCVDGANDQPFSTIPWRILRMGSDAPEGGGGGRRGRPWLRQVLRRSGSGTVTGVHPHPPSLITSAMVDNCTTSEVGK
jgi:hypothetical protein